MKRIWMFATAALANWIAWVFVAALLITAAAVWLYVGEAINEVTPDLIQRNNVQSNLLLFFQTQSQRTTNLSTIISNRSVEALWSTRVTVERSADLQTWSDPVDYTALWGPLAVALTNPAILAGEFDVTTQPASFFRITTHTNDPSHPH